MVVVVWLLAGTPKPDRSKGRSQTKGDTLALQVVGWAQGQHPRPGKISIPLKTLNYGARVESVNIKVWKTQKTAATKG